MSLEVVPYEEFVTDICEDSPCYYIGDDLDIAEFLETGSFTCKVKGKTYILTIVCHEEKEGQ